MEPTSSGSMPDPRKPSNDSEEGTRTTPSRAIDPRTLKPPVALSAERSKQVAGATTSASELDAHTAVSKGVPAVSSAALKAWRCSITTFPSFYDTKPEAEHNDIDWDAVVAAICPATPKLLEDKQRGTFFLPCALKDAPLVGSTLETAQRDGQPTTGKMRSKSHVTTSTMLVIDIDGMQVDLFEATLEKLRNDDITHLAYTTHSHGAPGKPGVRVRMVVPVDRPLNAEEYQSAWHRFDRHYFGGAAGQADSSSAHLYQQQGTWMCHPTRMADARRWAHRAGVASVGSWLTPAAPSQASPMTMTSTASSNTTGDFPPSDADRVADRCLQIGRFREERGANQREPLWFDCLGVVGHCENGEQYALTWSSGHPGYSEAETRKKLKNRVRTPPTTCDQFKRSNADGCVGCKEKVKSPITLGYDREEFSPEPTSIVEKTASSKSTDTQARSKSNEASTAGSDVGRTPFPIIEPCRDPVEPAQVLDAVLGLVDQYIVADSHQKIATALWIAMTWFMDRINVAPLLLVTAAERESGKSQLLTLIGKLCARPLTISNMTTAFIFRAITKWRPTMMVDEVDTFLRENAEQRGLINAGHTRDSAFVGRVSGEEHEPTMYDVWCAKALAGIALERHLPDATMSRGIVISMRRKLKGEVVGRLRHADPKTFPLIASQLARFAQDFGDQVSQARPILPDALSDRQQDNWEPLFAIAECAGPAWLARCEEAALALSRSASLAEDTGNSLLRDIREIFEREGWDKISSATLIEELTNDDEAGWSTYNRGKEITPRQVATLLKPYGIIPKTVRLGHNETPKGYDRAQFEDAFARYLPEPAAPEPAPEETLIPPRGAAPDTPPDDPGPLF